MKGIKRTKMWENKEKKRIKWNVPELLLEAVIILLAPLDPLGGRVWFIPFIPKNSNYFYDFFIFLFFLFNFHVILFILFLIEHFSVQPMKMMREMVSTFSRSLLLKQNFSLTRQTKGYPRLIWLQRRER